MPGREKEVWDYYRNNANALAQLRAPIYEDKVVDFILELATVTERKVTREELFKDEDARKPPPDRHQTLMMNRVYRPDGVFLARAVDANKLALARARGPLPSLAAAIAAISVGTVLKSCITGVTHSRSR